MPDRKASQDVGSRRRTVAPRKRRPTPVAGEKSAAERAIRAAIARFARDYAAGDVDGVMACYGPDMVKDRHGVGPEPRSQTAERLRSVLARRRGALEVTVDEILVVGSLAVVRGGFVVTLTPRAGGSAERFHRRYLEVWRKIGARWVVVRAMDNLGAEASA